MSIREPEQEIKIMGKQVLPTAEMRAAFWTCIEKVRACMSKEVPYHPYTLGGFGVSPEDHFTTTHNPAKANLGNAAKKYMNMRCTALRRWSDSNKVPAYLNDLNRTISGYPHVMKQGKLANVVSPYLYDKIEVTSHIIHDATRDPEQFGDPEKLGYNRAFDDLKSRARPLLDQEAISAYREGMKHHQPIFMFDFTLEKSDRKGAKVAIYIDPTGKMRNEDLVVSTMVSYVSIPNDKVRSLVRQLLFMNHNAELLNVIKYFCETCPLDLFKDPELLSGWLLMATSYKGIQRNGGQTQPKFNGTGNFIQAKIVVAPESTNSRLYIGLPKC